MARSGRDYKRDQCMRGTRESSTKANKRYRMRIKEKEERERIENNKMKVGVCCSELLLVAI